LLLLLIEEHLRVGFYCNEPQLPPKLIYRYHRKLGDVTVMSCLHALADARATRGPDAGGEFLEKHEEVVNAILWHHYFGKELVEPIPLLNGDDIMAATGLPEGPKIGLIKEALLEAQVEGTVKTADQAKDFVRRLADKNLETV
jgi:poly(A) polymerase